MWRIQSIWRGWLVKAPITCSLSLIFINGSSFFIIHWGRLNVELRTIDVRVWPELLILLITGAHGHLARLNPTTTLDSKTSWNEVIFFIRPRVEIRFDQSLIVLQSVSRSLLISNELAGVLNRHLFGLCGLRSDCVWQAAHRWSTLVRLLRLLEYAGAIEARFDFGPAQIVITCGHLAWTVQTVASRGGSDKFFGLG